MTQAKTPDTTKPTNEPPKSRLGITVTGLVNDVRQTKNGNSYMMKITTDSSFITVFSKENGLKVGDDYVALLRGLSVDKYGGLTAFEAERLG